MLSTRIPQPLPIERLQVRSFTIPTEAPESDGTLRWDATTLVLVQVTAGGVEGIGYSYTDRAAAQLIHDKLRPLITGLDALDGTAAWQLMIQATRNLGRSGITSTAIAAVDIALWDLKSKLLGVGLVRLLGSVRQGVPIYGSGGFTSYDDARLGEQLSGWSRQGIRHVKMKIGRVPQDDPRRVAVARKAVGPDVELMVDANGAYSPKTALSLAEQFAELGVTWFEEPVSSDDLAGLRLVRERVAPPIEVTAGEYGYQAIDFRRMLEAGAVDVLQPDVTRCSGISGFLAAATLADVFHVPLSAHCAPGLHMHLGCALPGIRHIEYFHDHVRIESQLFEGLPEPRDGCLFPDETRPGLGLQLREADAARYENS